MKAKIIEILNKAISKSGMADRPAEDIIKTLELRNVYNKDVVESILEKYFQYVLSYRIKNISTEEKFIGKRDKLLNIHDFIFMEMYRMTYPIPKTNKLVESLFGNKDFFQLVDKFNKYQEKVNSKRKAHETRYKKLLEKAKNDNS